MKLDQRSIYPFPYQGSKRKLAKSIMRYIPRGFNRFIEPFSGSSAMSIAMAHCGAFSEFWINDSNIQLMRLWRVILKNHIGLCDAYTEMWRKQLASPVEYYEHVRKRYFLHRRATDLFFLFHRSANSIVRFDRIGGFSNTARPDRLGCKPSEVRVRVGEVASLLTGKTEVTSLDYRNVLSRSDVSDVVYIDPPYLPLGITRKVNYTGSFDHDSFCTQLEKLNSRGIAFLVSYGDIEKETEYGMSFDRSLQLSHVKFNTGNIGLFSGNRDVKNGGEMTEGTESLYLSRKILSRLRS